MSFPATVQLINAFQTPYDNAIATARTCYSSRLIYANEVSQDEKARTLRDKIAESTYQAGHHTTLQHATFQFALDKISRQTIWSFLHAHSFYNSEQVSQRFVKLKAENFIVPPMNEVATKIFKETCEKMVAAYFHLIDLIQPTVISEYQRIFPGRKMEDKRWASAIQKKSQEVARYVVPVAMSAHLYHTISGLTLHRYHKLMHQMDTPIEQAVIVEKMIAAVQAQDPLFFQRIEDPMPLEKTLEYELLKKFNGNKPANSQSIQNFIQEFDAGLGGKTSKLIDYKVNTEKTFAQSIRHVLGKTPQEISDAEAIDLVMNPASNHYFGEALNLANLGKLTRSMSHAHFTFQKKNQPHRRLARPTSSLHTRLTPGARDSG
jgi:thymidylate synthase ThyX